MKTKCLIIDDEPVAIRIIAAYLAQMPHIEVIAKCKNALEAMEALRKHKVDLMFLDIEMPQVTGIDFLKSLPNQPKVIFTTAYREFALEGFELEALDYLLKPISFERFLKAMNRYYQAQSAEQQLHFSPQYLQEEAIFVRAERKMVKINLSELLYIEGLKDYIKIQTQEKTILTKETLSELNARLPEATFMQIHRSYIIAMRHITAYTSESIEVQDRVLPIGRVYKNAVLHALQS